MMGDEQGEATSLHAVGEQSTLPKPRPELGYEP